MKLLLPDTVTLSPDLPDGVEAVSYDARQPVPQEHLDAEAMVIWGYSSRNLDHAAHAMPKLRLVQCLAAGPDDVVAVGFGDDVTICSGVGLHDLTVSEHALMLALALARSLPVCIGAQREHRWAKELGGPVTAGADGPVTSLRDANVLIWGFGSIARALAPKLELMGATVRGVARSAGRRGGYEVVTQESLAAELGRTDVLVMILPSGEATRNALDADRISQLRRGAFLVNVGRGTTVDEDALVAALRSGQVGGAGLDVTQTEPLPQDSALWEAPNLLLTPHTAGGRPIGADELIAANVRALLAGDELRNVIG